ncbi:MAG: LuxR C-terminal-related transcriptional regulator [Candidatus Korobacteraceae bacterium]
MAEQAHKTTRIPSVSLPGLILLDSSMMPIAWNAEAVQILTFPEKPSTAKKTVTLLLEKLPERLKLEAANGGRQTREFVSGRRQYTCTRYSLDMTGQNANRTMAVLLERASSPEVMLHQITNRFNLTVREREAVGYLLQGLTSKEIAQKMSISPNTVKAFLRLVMTKMAVSTRAGLIGRVAGIRPAPELHGEAFGRDI